MYKYQRQDNEQKLQEKWQILKEKAVSLNVI